MTKFSQFRHALTADGWDVSSIELASDCWWAKEIWQLTSQWTQKDRKVYASLLLDPIGEFDRNNPPDTAVWAICLTNGVPSQRPLDGVGITRNFEERASEIVALARSMRQAL